MTQPLDPPSSSTLKSIEKLFCIVGFVPWNSKSHSDVMNLSVGFIQTLLDDSFSSLFTPIFKLTNIDTLLGDSCLFALMKIYTSGFTNPIFIDFQIIQLSLIFFALFYWRFPVKDGKIPINFILDCGNIV
jgi:hypothetical protein